MWTSGIAACTLKLDLEMREIADCMAEFTECIQHDIANALQLLPGGVVVKRVRAGSAGSVYVDLEITAPGAAGREHELIGSLQRQASNPSSCLLSGIYTCKVLTIRAAARDQTVVPTHARARAHTHTHTRTHTHTGLDHKCGYARRGRRAEWRCTNHRLTRCRRGQ